MSKILDAMRDDAGERFEQIEYRLGTLDQVGLFPPPPEHLLLELDNITGSLISRRSSERGMVLVFTSAAAGEGTSFVSYCVARHLAYLLDGRIAWIDASYLSPNPRLLGREPSYRTLLSDPEHVSRLPVGAGLTVVGHGDQDIKHTEPAILNAMETAHMTRYADGAIMVVETRRLKYEVVRHGMEQLRSQGGKIFGTVLNKRTYQIPGILYRKL